MSADGRYIVFQSGADNLAPNDLNGSAMDIFVRDRQTGTTEFVSVNRFGTGSGNQGSGSGISDRHYYAITPDGRYVVFQSYATNLVATTDFNSSTDIFVRDLQEGTTALVSVNTSGTATGNDGSSLPVITPDGRFVAFQSQATNLTAQGSNGIFVRDMQTGTTTFASVNNSGVPAGAAQPDISDDGRVVAFQSNASNLAPNDTNGTWDIFVRDLQAGTTSLVSINASGTASANGFSGGIPPSHIISADGHHVLFQSAASDLTTNVDLNGTNDVFLRDLQTNTTRLISITRNGVAGGASVQYMPRPGISADGRYVVFDSSNGDFVSDDNNNTSDAFLRDVQSATTTLVSVNSTGTNSGNSYSGRSVITPNGRYICFISAASNLTANDTNGLQDVFVRDMQSGVTRLVSASSGGTSNGNGYSDIARLTPDGRYIAFNSNATNLVPTPDTNNIRDVFIFAAEPQFGALEFEETAHTISEDGGTATITVTRTGGWDGPVSVNYTTTDGTAIAGEDYVSSSGTLMFPDGVPSQSFTIAIINDTVDEENETVNFTLSSPAGGAVLGAAQSASLTILDNEPLISIGDASFSEGNVGTTNAAVMVTLAGPSSFPITVNFATADGTATSGDDYQAASGTLTFNPGETSLPVNVTINGNTLVEPDETFFINLSDPTTTDVGDALAIVTISNDDFGGTLQFSSANFNANEDSKSALVTVTRANGSASGISVQYTTSNGTAIAGEDYTATNGTLNFGADETSKTFTIPILDNAMHEGNETLDITLSLPAGGASLGSPSTAMLTIIDNDQYRPISDFDGDGKSDVSVFRPSSGSWYLLRSTAGFTGVQFGATGDVPVAGDYDGDGVTDIAVWRPSNGTWYLLQSTAGFIGVQFGQAGDIPVPAYADGDDKTDIRVFRPAIGYWYRLNSSNGQFVAEQFGATGDIPVVGDYDGDGLADLAVFRPSTGSWYLLRTTAGFTGVQFGQDGDKPVAGDFDGDGKSDIAVFRPSNGGWYLQRSTAGFTGVQFGLSSDLPSPGDYDGDGKTDIAVFRPSTGAWYLLQLTAGFTGVQFGVDGDVPVPAAYFP